MENNIKTLKEAEDEVVDSFSMYDEWLDKYEYLIDLGKNLAPYPDSSKTDDRLIKGCQSRVWLDYQMKDGKLWFTADSDAIITKGIISLLATTMAARMISRRPCRPTKAMMNAKTLVVPIIAAKP